MNKESETINYGDAVIRCGNLLAEKSNTIAFAESATAGKLAYAFSLTPYSGAILRGSIVCYNACVKEDVLGVTKEIVDRYTPESAEVTREMCKALKLQMPADVIVAVTGLTAPGGSETKEKPVGTMFFCILYKELLHEYRMVLKGTPTQIVDKSIAEICQKICIVLDGGSV
ncbi:CinA family protein [Sphingobacterium griseoflavum]|uniref:Damage-inducible protein CinA n=1 Tax=Sphingobacterium griseoflavum TaxID=1474952 RepID=A0ABQ3HZS9_9SPHI|nr:nicotinamide-nucleotide amidohydrolase family protein [Sphingobacterium griseoflavum]GHE42102.1 damage-inducible protein CinA [Sphingobacterium griseoflavum]